MIGLHVKITVQDGKQEEFEAIAKELQEAVNENEPGVQFYAFHRTDDPCVYAVLESYDSEESLNAHGQTEYFKRLGKAMGASMAGAPEIQRYTALS